MRVLPWFLWGPALGLVELLETGRGLRSPCILVVLSKFVARRGDEFTSALKPLDEMIIRILGRGLGNATQAEPSMVGLK